MEDTAKSVTISKTKPAKNTQNLVNCPICEEDIHDATSNTKGEDYVYCEGNCKTWLHRRCAGLSKHNFKLVIESNAPYLCTHCRLTEAEKKIEETNLQLQKLFSEFNGKLRAAHPVGDEHDCSLDPSATGTGGSFVSVASVQICSVCLLCIVDSLMRVQILLDESTHIHVLSSSPLAYTVYLFQLNSEYVYIIVLPCIRTYNMCVCMSMLECACVCVCVCVCVCA